MDFIKPYFVSKWAISLVLSGYLMKEDISSLFILLMYSSI